MSDLHSLEDIQAELKRQDMSKDTPTNRAMLDMIRNYPGVGIRFRRLFDEGDTSAHKYNLMSASNELVSILFAFAERELGMELFKQSALYDPQTLSDSALSALSLQQPADIVPNTLRCKHEPINLDDGEAGTADVIAPMLYTEIRWMSDPTNAHKGKGGTWYRWSGKVWELVSDSEVKAKVVQIGEYMLKEAGELPNEIPGPDGKSILNQRKRKYMAIARRTRDNRGASNIVELLKGSNCLGFLSSDSFDNNPFDLNTLSGIVDLRTGKIRPHDPKAMCSRICPYPVSDDGMDEWTAFLGRITQNDPDLIEYLQRLAGLSIIGQKRNDILQLAHGLDGNNGKSTYYQTLLDVSGGNRDNGYSTITDPGIIVEDSRPSTPVEVRLFSIAKYRFAVCAETKRKLKLNEEGLKRVASAADTSPMRGFYSNPSKAKIDTQVILHTNNLPELPSTMGNISRRIHLIPFEAQLPKEGEPGNTPNFSQQLLEDAGGAVLKWMIEGAVKHIASGWNIDSYKPECAKDAEAKYLEGDGWGIRFISEFCEKDEKSRVLVSELLERQQAIAKQESGASYTKHKRSEMEDVLIKLGYAVKRSGNLPYVWGLRLIQ